MLLTVCIIIILTVLFYFTGIKPIQYWKKLGIPSPRPWPYFGNLIQVAFRKRALPHVVDDSYRAFPEKRYYGFYNFSIPSLMIRDPELIKKITVKDFETFPERRTFLPEGVDPLWSKNLFAIRGGEKWQNLRATLSPAYTSSKMKMMFELMKDCSAQFCNYFSKQDGIISVELKDAFTRFTNDVIATTAFGVACDSLENKENEFYLMGKEITSFTGIKSLAFIINAISPTLAKMLNVSVFAEKTKSFFRNLIKDTIKVREEKCIIRPDMLHLLMEAKKGRLKEEDHSSQSIDTGFATVQESDVNKMPQKKKIKITDEDIIAQAMIFFFAGFDTVSTMMSFACYELALNPEIQQTLYREVAETLEKSQGNITYENLMEMRYMDAVIAETLRKWPPFVLYSRRSVAPFTIEPESPDEKPLHLPKGSICLIPVYSIQRDPSYYPDPNKFDPERFNEENKGSINPFTYLPFGAGPRNCIGSRFGLIEGKLIVAEIIRNFEIVPIDKTQIPIKISKRVVNPIPDEGMWLGLKLRKQR